MESVIFERGYDQMLRSKTSQPWRRVYNIVSKRRDRITNWQNNRHV